MTTLTLTEANLAQLKKVLRARLPRVKSSHVDEAMARAMGHRTYTSLRVEMKQYRDPPESATSSVQEFTARLNELGYGLPISEVIGPVAASTHCMQ